MKKTKIKYEDIKAGDLLQTVESAHGVKWELTGIAYEKIEHGEDSTWQTSQGGDLVGSLEDVAIYRLQVQSDSFDEIRSGDLIRVTETLGNVTTITTGKAVVKTGGFNQYWVDGSGGVLVFERVHPEAERYIEIVERGND